MEARANTDRHRQRQQKLKEQVDTRVAAATEQKGVLIVFTGNGKGKSTAAFGTATRAVGHGKTVGVAQFIKGQWDNGEYNTLQPLGVEFHIMGTGFTWRCRIGKRIYRRRKPSGRKEGACSPIRVTIWWCWMN